jgi:tetratricopeptide (TPR) repeat protein
MQIDTLHAELERLFDLVSLLELAQNILGFEPSRIGGTAACGSFARALVGFCVDQDAVEALCDAVRMLRPQASLEIDKVRAQGLTNDAPLASGQQFAGIEILRIIGSGRYGHCYAGRLGERQLRVKVLNRPVLRDRRGLQRLGVFARFSRRITHPALPANLELLEDSGRVALVHDWAEGVSIRSRLEKTGPMHLAEARPILEYLLDGLVRLHEARLIHGAIHLDNIILGHDNSGNLVPVLLDGGMDRITVSSQQLLAIPTISQLPHYIAPELISCQNASLTTDVYAFGAAIYEIITGKHPFDATGVEGLYAHVHATPPYPSTLAPRGWVTRDVDEFVLSLLAKDPLQRPTGAQGLMVRLQALDLGTSAYRVSEIPESEIDSRIEALLVEPDNADFAAALDAAVDAGADPSRVADALFIAASSIPAHDFVRSAARQNLLLRAAGLFEHAVRNLDKAEQVYALALEADPTDDKAATAIERVLRGLGKFEELIEVLLQRGQQAESRTERGRAFAEIGRIYLQELGDLDQSLVAYTQALCEDVQKDQYAEEIERLAGSRHQAWLEVLDACNAPLEDKTIPADVKNNLLVRVGRWYGEKASRPDMATSCFQAVISTDPSNESALESLAQIYRKSQQWPELGAILARSADAAPTPARARDLRTDTAELLERQMNDFGAARQLYETVLADDPSHARAVDGFGRICERTGDWGGYIKVLEARRLALRDDEQLAAACKIAETYELRLSSDAEAIHILEAARAQNPDYLDVLKALDRLYSKAGRYRDVVDVLDRQLQLATTPRQQILLLERIASVYEEEFLDYNLATEAYKAILDIDQNHETALVGIVRAHRAQSHWEQVAEYTERHLLLATAAEQKIALGLQLGRVFGDQLQSPERAMQAFEDVLLQDPQQAEALERLARLRESLGDAEAALAAIDTLAEKATTPEAKAEQYLRGARLLQGQGDLDAAIERYKQALDAFPRHSTAGIALREAYLARGDANAATHLIEQEIQHTEGVRAKARLYGEMAAIAYQRTGNFVLAEDSAKTALKFDPTNLDALTTLGDIAFDGKRFIEASKYFEQVIDRIETLRGEEAARVLSRAVNSLVQSGNIERAHSAMDALMQLAPENGEVLIAAAGLLFEKGEPARLIKYFHSLLENFGSTLRNLEFSRLQYQYGEALRRDGRPEAAVEILEAAIDADPGATEPLVALASCYAVLQRWHDVIRTKNRHLDLAIGEDRVQLLIDIGDITADKLGDRRQAAKNLVAALEDRPDDRRLLTKLMQLYSEEKDWNRLVDIVIRLANFQDDPKQRAKYLNTAAIVTARQLGDVDSAIDLYEQVIELDPAISKALNEVIALRRTKGDLTGVDRLLRRKLEIAIEANDAQGQLEAWTSLGRLYENELGWIDHAIVAYEKVQELEPTRLEHTEKLAALYATEPARWMHNALMSQLKLLEQNPFRVESYKAMRRLHTEGKNADGAWCLCQALTVLNLSEADEERFYRRMRAETAAPAQSVLQDEDWQALIHADINPLLTHLFAVIEPAIVAVRAPELKGLGVDPTTAIDVGQTPLPMPQTLFYAAGVLGLELPNAYVIPDDPGGLSFLIARPRGIGLGRVAMSSKVPPQAAAFIAARHLTYFRPGFYVRQVLASGSGLRSWLFAAIKLISPQFPIAPDIEGSVMEAYHSLDKNLKAVGRDELTRVVSTLLREGTALDLKRWVAGVDQTADRVGFAIAHDLDTAAQVIRASDENATSVPNQERLKSLAVFSVSPNYLGLRRRLGIAVDS